jgi:hypothetical protein
MGYYFSPNYGGYPYPVQALVQDFTPVVIDFKAAMLDIEDNPVFHHSSGRKKPKYTMRISPPRSVRRGVKQYLCDSIVFPIPEDGVVRFKLPPSMLYLPRGRYIVEFFRSGSQIPFDTQRWLVPAIPKRQSYTFTYDESDPDPTLPLYVWSIDSVSPAAEFVANYNTLIWLAETRPAFGTSITATYTPAVTLDQLIEYKSSEFEGVTRVRP